MTQQGQLQPGHGDSWECLRMFQDLLHENYYSCVFQVNSVNPLVIQSIERLRVDGMSTHDQNLSRMPDRGLISSIFSQMTGQTVTDTKCPNCQHVSHQFETFRGLELAIQPTAGVPEQSSARTAGVPELPPAMMSSRQSGIPEQSSARTAGVPEQGSAPVCLHELFHRFNQQIQLDENERYLCDGCQLKQRSYRQTQLWRLPNILVIGLKRFRVMADGRSVRDRTPIKIPLTLDLRRYLSADSPFTNPHLYDLYGLCCQTGTLDRGHYWSVLRKDQIWYTIDDEQVLDHVEEHQFVGIEPYLLFYRGRQ
jgi:ubiquitin C-terminal hydrolase